MSTFKDPSTANKADVEAVEQLLAILLEKKKGVQSPYSCRDECVLCQTIKDDESRFHCLSCPLFSEESEIFSCTLYIPKGFSTRWHRTIGIINQLRWYLATIRELKQWIETAWEKVISCS